MTQPHVIRSIPRIPEELLERFSSFSSADLHEASGQFGAMHSSIKSVTPGLRLLGSALTVLGRPNDDLIHHLAIHIAQKDDVIVADVGGDTESAIWGGLMSLSAQQRGSTGLIVDGAVRDVDEIRDAGFPVFAKAICIKGAGKEKVGWINHPIVCGAVYVRPGDLVVGDDNGVVVVPRERLLDVLRACEARKARERNIVRQIRAGKSTYEIMGLADLARQKGITWEELS